MVCRKISNRNSLKIFTKGRLIEKIMYSIVTVPSTKKLLRCTAKAATSHNLTLHVQLGYNAIVEIFGTYCKAAACSELKLF